MATYKTPGVYIKEIDLSQNAQQATAAPYYGSASIVLKAPKGPVNQVRTITNVSDFVDMFGIPEAKYDSVQKQAIATYGYGMYAATEYLTEGSYLNTIRVASDGDLFANTTVKFDTTAVSGTIEAFYDDVADAGIDPILIPLTLDTPDEISVLDDVANHNTGAFSFSAIAPGVDYNNTAVKIEFFSTSCDWKYAFDDDVQIDEFVRLIESGTSLTVATPATDDEIALAKLFTDLKAPKVSRVTVYRKQTDKVWPVYSNKSEGSAVETTLVTFTTGEIIDTTGKSLLASERINGNSNFVYFTPDDSFTDTDIKKLIISKVANYIKPTTDSELRIYPNLDFYLVDAAYNTAAGTGLIVTNATYQKGKQYRIAKAVDVSLTTGTVLTPVVVAVPGTTNGKEVIWDSSSAKIVEIEYSVAALNTPAVIVSSKSTTKVPVVKTDGVYTIEDSDTGTAIGTFSFPALTLTNQYNIDLSKVKSVFSPLNFGANATTNLSDEGNLNGWQLLSNKKMISTELILVPTSNMAVKQEVDTVISKRLDCLMVTQSGSRTDKNAEDILASELYGYVNQSYIALYDTWKKKFDKYSGKYIFLPNSISAAKTMVYTSNVANIWDSPAGTTRGNVDGTKLNTYLSDDEVGVLYSNNINSVVLNPDKSQSIMGQKTAQRKSSALDRVNVRRLMLYIEKVTENILRPYVLTVANTDTTRQKIYGQLTNFLDQIKSGQGLYDFKVICSGDNNTADIIDANQLNVDILLKPTKTIEFISVNVIVTNTGVDFGEIVTR